MSELEHPNRRALLRQSGLALLGAGLYGVAPFYGPWKHNRAWAQGAQKKPLVIGLTMDASGQYGPSLIDGTDHGLPGLASHLADRQAAGCFPPVHASRPDRPDRLLPRPLLL